MPAVARHVDDEPPVVGTGAQVEQVARVRAPSRIVAAAGPVGGAAADREAEMDALDACRSGAAGRRGTAAARPGRRRSRPPPSSTTSMSGQPAAASARSSALSASARARVTVSRPSRPGARCRAERVRPDDRLLDGPVRARRGEPPRRRRGWARATRAVADDAGAPSRTSIPSRPCASTATGSRWRRPPSVIGSSPAASCAAMATRISSSTASSASSALRRDRGGAGSDPPSVANTARC